MQTEFPITEAERIFILCDFIEQLRSQKGLFQVPQHELKQMAESWNPVIAGIHEEILSARDEKSLFVAAARLGYTEAAQIYNLFQAGAASAEETMRLREEEAASMAEFEPIGPNRRDLQQWLSSKGVKMAHFEEALAR